MPHISFLKELSGDLVPEELQRRFLSLLLNLQNVERGSIWIQNGPHYQCVEALGRESEGVKGIKIPSGKKSIVGWVIENGKMTIAEGHSDQRHHKELEKGFETKSRLILCFPLLLTTGEVYGAVQVIDTSARGNRLNLSPEYLKLLHDMVDIGSVALSNSLRYTAQLEHSKRLKKVIEDLRSGSSLVGVSKPYLDTMELISNYSRTDYPVLISGESGTGKELIAREIHKQSDRADSPLLVQNCSAIPNNLLESELFGYEKGAFTGALGHKPGLFEAANGGTVFLDEIGEMDVHIQAKLLRVLQDGEIKPLGGNAASTVDVRIISATNIDLNKAIADHTFREDLFFRLNVLPLRMTPLRERREDIPFLAEYFLKREAMRTEREGKRLSSAAMETLMCYSWPGNVRELENLIKQLMVMVHKSTISQGDLPPHTLVQGGEQCAGLMENPALLNTLPPSRLDLEGMTWADVERNYSKYLLARFSGNISKAATMANLNRSTFASRLKRLGIDMGREKS